MSTSRRNAGMASAEALSLTDEGIEITFASSVPGHHVLTLGLLEAGLLNDGARVVIAGSEAVNNDLPGLMDMKVFDFVTGPPAEFGATLATAMDAFVRGEKPQSFRSTRYYATTKVFTAWWAAAMARRFGNRIAVTAVSPGSNMSTNTARNMVGFKKFLFTKIMPTLGPIFGIDQPVAKGAGRYLSVLHAAPGEYTNGSTYTSKAGKLVGPLHKMEHPHLLDVERQDVAWGILSGIASG